MKHIFYLLAVLFIFWACKGPKEMIEGEKEDVPETASGSVEYGIETYDAKFKTWYDLQKSQDTKQSQKYYENWNKKYVKEWNRLASQKDKNDFYVPIVGYNRTRDLGFEINHQLFYYFQYVENVLKMQILHDGPKAGNF
ncbi:MAG: hypothetical protein Q7U86_06925 [Draconibacterium sp.]|nr:hypothetical protein [Draconibacterium sp.]